MTLCEVPWCVALTSDRFCAVHREHPTLRPAPLAPDEELVDGAFGQCNDCGGTGECDECLGSGECECECSHGHMCEHDCEVCAGTGKCKPCGGTGFSGVRKKAA